MKHFLIIEGNNRCHQCAAKERKIAVWVRIQANKKVLSEGVAATPARGAVEFWRVRPVPGQPCRGICSFICSPAISSSACTVCPTLRKSFPASLWQILPPDRPSNDVIIVNECFICIRNVLLNGGRGCQGQYCQIDMIVNLYSFIHRPVHVSPTYGCPISYPLWLASILQHCQVILVFHSQELLTMEILATMTRWGWIIWSGNSHGVRIEDDSAVLYFFRL